MRSRGDGYGIIAAAMGMSTDGPKDYPTTSGLKMNVKVTLIAGTVFDLVVVARDYSHAREIFLQEIQEPRLFPRLLFSEQIIVYFSELCYNLMKIAQKKVNQLLTYPVSYGLRCKSS